MAIIYMDYNATTPIDKEVQNSMLPYLTEKFGNPSSSHEYGQIAGEALKVARRQVASLVHCSSEEIIFLSGGTESINYALKGTAARALRETGRNHIITSCIEHVAVLETCSYLENTGFQVTYLKVDEFGRVNLQDIAEAVNEKTMMVSIMHSNNEVGTLQPIKEIANLLQEISKSKLLKHKIFFHTDASQSLGKVPLNVAELGVDMLTIAGHKLYAPKGIGALFLKKGTPTPDKLLHGGNQENGFRAGTENVLLAVGLGKACEVVQRDLASVSQQLGELRNALLSKITKNSPVSFVVNGHPELHLPNTLSISFQDIPAYDILSALEGKIAASSGSACHSPKEGEKKVKISYILEAMKVPENFAMGTLRLSVGKYTTMNDIDLVATYIVQVLSDKLKKVTPTLKLYFKDSHLFQENAQVISIEKKILPGNKDKVTGDVVILDQTLFHPQGGGQPSDVGIIRSLNDQNVEFQVNAVRADPETGLILHYGNFVNRQQFQSGETVVMVIDELIRLHHCRLHSGGHLIDKAMANLNWIYKPSKGYHFTDAPFVEYIGNLSRDQNPTEMAELLEKECQRLIAMDIPTLIHDLDVEATKQLCGDSCDVSHLPQDKPIRVIELAEFGCPCGGTHVKSTGEIGNLQILKIKGKGGKFKVSYKIT